jgi:HAD superfamily hydrolase (TIGR01509 family)
MFDSKQANIAYYNHILLYFDLPAMTPEQVHFTHMHTVKESLAHLIIDKKTLEAAHAYRNKMGYLPFISEMVIEPHLKPLLNQLRPRFATAIATNRTNTMNRVLKDHGLTDLFDLVVSAMDVVHPKPDPEQLVRIRTHFGIESQQMVFIGDSELDQAAADAAGVPFIAYGNPVLKAAAHITSLREAKRLLEP